MKSFIVFKMHKSGSFQWVYVIQQQGSDLQMCVFSACFVSQGRMTELLPLTIS